MIKNFKPALAAAAVSLAMLSSMAGAAEEQFFPLIDYRVGPYGANGQSFYGGFIDYLNYVNLTEKGVNGVMMTYEECETEYNNAKGVECYERLKGKAAKSAGPLHTMSTGISYALIDKSAQDKLPLAMMGYGRTHAAQYRIERDDAAFAFGVDALPLVEVFPLCAETAQPRSGAVGEDDEGVVPKEMRDGLFVIAQVVLIGVFEVAVAGFEFDEDQRQDVDEANKIGAAIVVGRTQPGDLQFAHHQNTIVGRLAEIDDYGLRVSQCSLRVTIAHRNTVAHQLVKSLIVPEQRARIIMVRQLGHRLVDCRLQQRRVELR